MLARSVAVVIALITGTAGILPSVGWHRCLWMAERMPEAHACCPQRQDTSPTTIGAPCCEAVAAAAKPARATNAAPDQGLTAPILVGILSFTSLGGDANAVSARAVAAYPRGQPPGDRLHSFSPILRV